jgi:hypothetical protein
MISTSQAQRAIKQLDQKVAKMEKALAECQTKYDKGQKEYAKLVTLHLGKQKEPQSLRTQERSLDSLRNRIEALQQSIYLHQSQRGELEKQLNLKKIHDTHSKAFVEAEDKFRAAGEALAVALGDLRQKIDSFNDFVDEFFTIANLPLERLQGLLASLDEGIWLEKFVREGKIEEKADHDEFLTTFGSTYTETANALPLLDEELLAHLAYSAQAIHDWVIWARRANWGDVVSRSIDFSPKQYQKPGTEPVKAGISSQVVRVPLRPEVSNDHKERLECKDSQCK